ncbi:MAG: 16S rRNA (guanine(527)-N(7))-methyltransferase RsmG [Actinobacteria bacterium]|nr:16S rRNA (guanine(527)-N(7))-methyltransferase RsmG [Actinomycetota bacterium]
MLPIEKPSQLLIDGCAVLNVGVDDAMVGLFFDFLKELRAWNERFNLTAITDERDIVIKHFLDSLALLSRFNIPRSCTVIDIGAGAGFPGIPLKIVRPDIRLTLLESSKKKVGFLRHIITMLGLANAGAISERAEDFGQRKENREYFCLAVSRAVADFVVLLEYALPMVKVGGRFICYKSRGVYEEVSRAGNALNLLGGRIEEVTKVVVPFLNADRYFVSVAKVASSPRDYPRRAGIPAKKPLL